MSSQSGTDTEYHQNVDHFLAALTDLSLRYGIGIAGAPELFLLEPEDRSRTYRMDDESRISFE